jgi:hypothetical protein
MRHCEERSNLFLNLRLPQKVKNFLRNDRRKKDRMESLLKRQKDKNKEL